MSTLQADSPATHSEPALQRTTLRARKGWQALHLGELWQYRELLWIFAGRDITVRYKQTALGVTWILLQPLLTTGIFTLIFGKLAQIPSKGPYALATFSGVLMFNLFSRCFSAASTSLVANQHLIKKIYFPRLIFPIAPALGALLDFGIGSIVLIAMMFMYGAQPGWSLLLIPLYVLLTVTAGIACGLWLGALNVKYRDVGVMMPFITQLWTYATPVVWELSLLQLKLPNFYPLFLINPITGPVEGFRRAIMGTDGPPWTALAASVVVTMLILTGGLYFFRRVEKDFADIV